MSNSKTPTRFAKVILRSAARLEKGVPENAERIRSRHAAITDDFNNWRSYKLWAEKIRGTWEKNGLFTVNTQGNADEFELQVSSS